MNISTEFEINYFFIEKPIIREKLKNINAALIDPERMQTRKIFDVPNEISLDYTEFLKLAKHKLLEIKNLEELSTFVKYIKLGDYVRVRDEGGSKISMSVKIHAEHGGGMSDQKESCLWVSSFDIASKLLTEMGLIQRSYQENLRETWRFENCFVEIDTWPFLPSYIEIEGETEDSVISLATKLGLNDLEKEKEIYSTFASVAYIYSVYYKIDSKVMLAEPELVFANRPTWAKAL